MCCDQGGCWKARTVPIGDGDEKDNPEHLCVDVVKKSHRPTGSKIDHTYHLPRCMDMISAEEVIRRIELYFTGGAVRYLTPAESRVAKKAIERSSVVRKDTERIKLS